MRHREIHAAAGQRTLVAVLAPGDEVVASLCDTTNVPHSEEHRASPFYVSWHCRPRRRPQPPGNFYRRELPHLVTEARA